MPPHEEPARPKGRALQHPGADPPRRHAGELIKAVLDNMGQNLEELRYSTLAPGRFVIYLHPAEFARLEGIMPILRQQTIRALTEELESLNRRPWWQRVSRGLLAADRVPVENAALEWHVEFVSDADGEIEEGGLAIDSELRLPADPELGVGEGTRRVTTRISAQGATTENRAENRPTESTPTASRPTEARRVVARLVYEDNEGPHSCDMVRDSFTIGRGGISYPVDVRIASSVDVSREHARIRRDPATGSFFLIDVSTLGTTLNGRHVPRGYDEDEGARRENGKETPLPDRARIGLAEMVYLDFQIVR